VGNKIQSNFNVKRVSEVKMKHDVGQKQNLLVLYSCLIEYARYRVFIGTSPSDLPLAPNPGLFIVIFANTFFELSRILSFVLCTLSAEKFDLFNDGRTLC